MKRLPIVVLFLACFLAGRAPAVAAQQGIPPSGEEMKWLVIFGSYSIRDRAAAEKRASLVRLQGCDVRIERSDDFPNLTPNLLVVISGPHSKSAAAQVVDWLGKRLPEKPYIKSYR